MLTRYGRRRKNLGFLGHDSSALTPQQQQERRQLRYELDLNSFNWKIWGVAASGFLTDSYNLFATNVILTSLAFVYWPDSGVHWQAMLVNVVTLFGSVCGQLAFGALADYYGRTRLYGIELVLMIVSTIGIATNRAEYGSMKFLPPFLWVGDCPVQYLVGGRGYRMMTDWLTGCRLSGGS
jgi:PHS family inorganic phosphate transporter-like MFS transporter